ncbi:major coat protein [Teredinibacter turnerae]|uniref:major coat protein n=1 Tax=Teredinibacter turnerae TaxID=2426 RepID=UPI0003662182|nr:major coat protein [Teredinibacter turnerae]
MKKLKRMKTKLGAVITIAAGAASSANAALPADAQTAVDSVSTFATDMITWAWPVVATVTVAAIGIKLFKKFTNKAT